MLPSVRPPPAVKGPFAVGEVVDAVYRIDGVIGHGGMGIVYEARDLRLERMVALKTALDLAWSPMIRLEAQALAAAHDGGIVRVHALGNYREHEYFVMERLTGVTLQSRIDELARTKQRFALGEALDLLIGIADALSSVHRIGLTHRDLKPGNVMLCGSRVVLVDFGLFIPEYAVADDLVVAGSAEYMAPETIARTVRPGSSMLVDLYALGVIGYELLAGQTPFHGRYRERILEQHLNDRPPPLQPLRPDAPAPLVKLIEALLEKSPDDRPPSAESVVWQLSEIRSPHDHVGRTLRVMVVDDDPHIGALLRRALHVAMPRLAVETETNPRAALEQIERDPPDVVVVDLNMPVLNGVEVAMAVSAIESMHRPRVVAMSGAASERDVAVMRAIGVNDFVSKDAAFVPKMSRVIAALRQGA